MSGSPYLDTAADATRWVLARTVPAPRGGLALPPSREPLVGHEPDGVADDLYAGGAGLLALAAEARLTGVDLPVDRVRDRVVERAASTEDVGLYEGIAGYGATLLAYAHATGDPLAAAGVDAAVVRLADAWTPDGWPPPARYAGHVYLDVLSGAAGVALFLVAAGTPAALALAERAGDLLLAHAGSTEAGLDWPMRLGDEERMPNFSHGTAGIATALALTGRACGRPDLVKAAARAADHLRSLAGPGPGLLLPSVLPPVEGHEPVSFGWCHGPTGTARLFWALDSPLEVDGCVEALLASGIPRRLRPGFWDNVGRCCGSAGVGDVVLDRYQQTGRPDLLDFAHVLADDILARATVDTAGARWSFTEHRNDEPDLPPDPGWMQGAAGIAAFLYRLHRVDQLGAAAPRIPWVDAPVG